MSHPSFLALDRHALGMSDPQTAAHVETCELCAAHVRAVSGREPIPDWVVSRKRTGRRQWVGWLALAAAVLLAIGVYREPAPAPYVGAKGVAEVTVFVQRNGEVSVWQGEAVRPGDRVRLGIQPTDLRYVTIQSGDETLFEGPISGDTDPWLVPASWEVDGEGDSEAITVILDDGPVRGVPSASAVAFDLILDKEYP